MGNYTKPPMDNLPFQFSQGGYTAPDFNALEFQFEEHPTFSASAYLQAAVNVISTQEDYVKECPTYVIGYGQSIQIIKGRCIYGGLRDIGALINGIRFQGQADLGATLIGLSDINESFLPAYIKGMYGGIGDMSGIIHAWHVANLPAEIGFLWAKNLPSSITAVAPVDLPAYLKVWPERYLDAYIRGWGAADLGARINQIYYKNLGAVLRPYKWYDINGILRGWGRTSRDLGGITRGVVPVDLPAFITSIEIKDLLGYIYAIAPIDLPAFIHGYQPEDLTGIINAEDYPYQLQGIITVSGGFKELSSYIKVLTGSGHIDLQAVITYYNYLDLNAYIKARGFYDLPAIIDTKRLYSDLAAEIYPKMVRMSAVISIPTLAHRNLYATINPACFYSMAVDLPGYLRVVYKRELPATIRGVIEYWGTANLAAKIGYAQNFYHFDRFDLVVDVRSGTYRLEDKLPIYIRIFGAQSTLSATVTGILRSYDLPAYVRGLPVEGYVFGDIPNRHKVITLETNGILDEFQMVEFKFTDIVRDYFYVDAEQKVHKLYKDVDRWVVNLSSYYPADELLRYKRRLHKSINLFDLNKFDNIDDAVKSCIHYVTTDFNKDLSAYLNITGETRQLGARVNGMNREYANLFSSINVIS